MIVDIYVVYHITNLWATTAIESTVKVLVTFIESVPIKPSFKKGSAQSLLVALKAHPLPLSTQVTDAEIEAQIQENTQSWE
ncbi:hypothetical protein TI05_06145 [Achromatium sp. WMS3]|nr:hypothetical protein TI05_06145 [Achromatium sp. WMS3]